MLSFNIKDGFIEAIARGYRSGILTSKDYSNLFQCENIDDVRLHLASSDYGPYLQNEPSQISTTTIVEKCTQKLVDDWRYLRAQAEEPLATFLDLCTYGHMIDNVVLIVTGTLHERDNEELLAKCHPLGMFDGIAQLVVATNMRELYKEVLIDTPLAPYFSEHLASEDLDEMHIEILRNTLYKAYLNDFYKFCSDLGGSTAEVMGELLGFEADRRALTITINGLGTALSRDDKKDLYCNFGALYPHTQTALLQCDSYDRIKSALQQVPAYKRLFTRVGSDDIDSIDKILVQEEIRLAVDTFQQQFHYGVFYAYIKLREQEIRNIMWVTECVAQDQKARISDGIVYMF